MNDIKLSTLDLDFIKNYMKIDFDDDDTELELYRVSALSFIQTNTNKDLEYLDKKPEIVIIALQLISHFYENKSITVSSNQGIDKMFTQILSQYREWL